MRDVELLIPASNLEVLKVAVLYGADAVYIGGEMYGLRAKAKNFSMEDVKEGIEFAHKHGVKVYITANIVAHNEDLEGIRKYFEELKEINPAIAKAKEGQINVMGPVSPDTLFARGKAGEFDAILALYHDQGHIPCKTLDLEESVSITLGLPFIRGSVDHGTAFDKAGKGIATNKSMVAAIRSTVKYASAIHENQKEA